MLYELKNTYNFPASLRAAESRVAIHFFHSIKNHFPQSLRAVEDGAAIHALFGTQRNPLFRALTRGRGVFSGLLPARSAVARNDAGGGKSVRS